MKLTFERRDIDKKVAEARPLMPALMGMKLKLDNVTIEKDAVIFVDMGIDLPLGGKNATVRIAPSIFSPRAIRFRLKELNVFGDSLRGVAVAMGRGYIEGLAMPGLTFVETDKDVFVQYEIPESVLPTPMAQLEGFVVESDGGISLVADIPTIAAIQHFVTELKKRTLEGSMKMSDRLALNQIKNAEEKKL